MIRARGQKVLELSWVFFSESRLTRRPSPSRLIHGDNVVDGVAFFIFGTRGADLFVR